ncbi:translocation protein Sec62-domain-containing protein [Lipomyces japonicus]|uniref:translocation protein Sec62-domain-containing protein n=1 Tax=Lipomyces japonicus TaxID=56871 RepID=UPI0034CF7EF1
MSSGSPSHQHQQIQQQQGPPPKAPQSLAIASFLRHNPELKQRQGILNGKRQDFFRVKRALRALQSSQYKAAQQKPGSLLPPVNNESDAIDVFRQLPINSLAIRVEKLTRKILEEKKKLNPNAQLPPASALSKTKGVATLAFVREQVVSADDDIYYVWLWEKVPFTTYVYAGLALVAIFAIVLFPIWPPKLRLGVWYLSMGLLGLLGAFFAMAIFRLILFVITYFVASPGLWLFPNLFEDVGFVDSFKPLYGWNVQLEKKKKKNKKHSKTAASTTIKVVKDEEEQAVEQTNSSS